MMDSFDRQHKGEQSYHYIVPCAGYLRLGTDFCVIIFMVYSILTTGTPAGMTLANTRLTAFAVVLHLMQMSP